MLTSVRVGPPTTSQPQFQFPAMSPPPRARGSALSPAPVPPRASNGSRVSSSSGYVVGSGSLNLTLGPPSTLADVRGQVNGQSTDARGSGSLNLARGTQSASLAEALGPAQGATARSLDDGKTWRTAPFAGSASAPQIGTGSGSGTLSRASPGGAASSTDQLISQSAPLSTATATARGSPSPAPPPRGDQAESLQTVDIRDGRQMSPMPFSVTAQLGVDPRRKPSRSPDVTPRRFHSQQRQAESSPTPTHPNGVQPPVGAAFTAARSVATLAMATKASKGERCASPLRAAAITDASSPAVRTISSAPAVRTPPGSGERAASPGRSPTTSSPIITSGTRSRGINSASLSGARYSTTTPTGSLQSSEFLASPKDSQCGSGSCPVSPQLELRANAPPQISSRTRPRISSTAVPASVPRPKSTSVGPTPMTSSTATRVPLRARSVTSTGENATATPSGSSQHSLTTTPAHTPPHGRGNRLSEREFSIVFLLPNVTESAEFMEVVFRSFQEDNPDAIEMSRIVLRLGDDVVQVQLNQLCPVDALEDVQRRARKVQSRRPGAPLRRSALRPRFGPMNGLPKVDDALSASCTMVVYLVRPFESPKDTERQMGPICIVEASYRGSSHAHCPVRMVVALEENELSEHHLSNGDAGIDGALGGGGGGSSGSSGAWAAGTSLGQFGADVADRLRQRGVDLPVISLERRSASQHRWLVYQISEVLASRSRTVASTMSTTTSTFSTNNLLCADGASASTDAATDTEWHCTAGSATPVPTRESTGSNLGSPVSNRPTAVPGTGATVPSSASVSGAASRPSAAPASGVTVPSSATAAHVTSNGRQTWSGQGPRDRPTNAEVAAISSAMRAAGVPANLPAGAGEGKLHWTEGQAGPTRTSSASSTLSASLQSVSNSTQGRANAAAVENLLGPMPAEAQVLTRADVEAAAAEAFAAARAVPEGVDARTATETAEAARAVAEAFQAAEAAANVLAQSQKPPANIAAGATLEPVPTALRQAGAKLEPAPTAPRQPMFEEEADEDKEAIPAPIVQVGDSRFCLPPPEIAVRRIAELWKPGAAMVVITTQHYGTPLLCPDGDIMKGLVNIAPSTTGGKNLVPLFWQNIDEVEQEESNGLDAPAGPAGPGNGALAGSELTSMGSQLRLSRTSQLPTMVEEEEEDEDG